LVKGHVLVGDDLRTEGRERAARMLADGADRKGLGPRLAKTFDPPMGDRWGQEIVKDLAGLEPAEV
jgi:hypothetical protein